MKKILLKWGFSRKGVLRNTKGEWFLFTQLLIILLHFLPAYPKTDIITFPTNIFFNIIGILISIHGLKISFVAFLDLGDNLTPLPFPMEEGVLIKSNSYRNSRHPLYKGLLFISLGIFIFSSSLLHLALFISLAFVLRIKALKEEERLKVKFPEYKTYMKEVPAIFKNIKYLDWR